MTENRIYRLLVALFAGIVMGLVSSYMSARASATPIRPHVGHSVVTPAVSSMLPR